MGTKQGKEPLGLKLGCFPAKVSVKNIFKPGQLICLAACFPGSGREV